MAKILYGVQSGGSGHVTRALTVARNLPEHEFNFVCSGVAAEKAMEEYPVSEIAGLEAVVEGNRTRYLATASKNLKILSGLKTLKERMNRLIEKFQPDVAITDFEFPVQWTAQALGIPCISLDHQHLLTSCRLTVPLGEMPKYLIDRTIIRVFLQRASYYLVTSFFHPPLKSDGNTFLVGPILRDIVIQRNPVDGDHIVAFRGFKDFDRIIQVLQDQARPVIIYGYDTDRTEGNLTFKKKSQNGFLDDLASCAYVICGGGHTLVSEAFYYGKPVLTFPGAHFEQRLSSTQLESLGYGRYVRQATLNGDVLPQFESRLTDYRKNIASGHFCGNGEALALLRRFAERKPMTGVGEDGCARVGE